MHGRSRAWLLLVALLPGCGSEPPRRAPEPARTLAADTAHVDLSTLHANIPPPARDTFTPLALKVESIPEAPHALLDAAEREEGISRFCYQEFGQKADPRLVGAVALIVTVDANMIQSVRIGAEDWSSKAGRGVMSCLVQKAPQAWRILPGAHVAPGRYVIQLRFRPS